MADAARRRSAGFAAAVLLLVCGGFAGAAPARAAGWTEATASADGSVRDTRMSRVFPARKGHPAWGYVGPRAVTDAWGGAAYDPKRDLLVVTGGGHGDYGGNEVYAFSTRSLKWLRLTEPSLYEPGRPPLRTVDGTPTSRHTYDGVEYVAALDRVLVFGGSLWPDGGAYDRHAWLFDVDRRSWTKMAAAPVSRWAGMACERDSGQCYVRLAAHLLRYDSRRDVWAPMGQQPWLSGGTLALDPVLRRLVFVADGATWHYDLGRPGPLRPARAATSGDLDIESHADAGLAWDSRRRRIVAWTGERAVWTLDARSMVWRRHDNRDGRAPTVTVLRKDGRTASRVRGIYGRWRYVPRLDAFVALTSARDNVWFYRFGPDSR